LTIEINKYIIKNIPFYGAERIIYMYHSDMDKYVYLIGERHSDYSGCQNSKNISNLLINYLKFSDKFIDVFLETDFKLKGKDWESKSVFESKSNIIDKFRNKLSECFELSKEKCNYYNVRFHYIDSRNVISVIIENKPNILIYFVYYLALLPAQLNYYGLKYTQAYKDSIINMYKEFNNPKAVIKLKKILKNVQIKEQFINFFNSKSFDKLNKNYENIDSDIISYLNEFVQKQIDNVDLNFLMYDNINKSITQLYENIDKNREYINSNYSEIINSFGKTLPIFSTFMDIYTLSRLFRRYRNVKYQNSNPAKYSIIITGDAHTSIYYQILKDLGFKKIEYQEKLDDGCIHDIKQPLFYQFV
jgi:hypothetical protein